MKLNTPDWPDEYGRRIDTVGIVIHHTAALTTWEAIDRYHRSKGWGGIGYNMGVSGDGSVWLFGDPLSWRAHTYGYNGVMAGVAIMCLDAPNDAQIGGARSAIAYLRSLYGPVPLYRHSDLVATSCPGQWDISVLEGSMTPGEKLELLDHLSQLWGISVELDMIRHPAEAIRIRERLIAIKQLLLLDLPTGEPL